jgi:hypothetical protein
MNYHARLCERADYDLQDRLIRQLQTYMQDSFIAYIFTGGMHIGFLWESQKERDH